MVIKETHIFTKIIDSLLDSDEYCKLQELLVNNPKQGDIIKGSGGLRKLRWKITGHGKRGGIRAIYYHLNKDDQIYMLYAYKKNRQNDLTKEQLKYLIKIVKEELSS